MRAKRGFWFCVLSLFLAAGSAQAQTINPTTVQFTASIAHDATAPDGTPLLTSYELDFFLVGAQQPFQTLSLGKPTPDASSTITVNFANLLGGALPLPGIVYDATVVAIGPGGLSPSTLSNTFEYLPPCSYSVSPTSATPASSGGAATTAVTTTSGCAWTAASNATWLMVTSGASGTGSGTVSYTVAANTLTSSRSGTLTVAGQTVTITQAAAPCSYSVSPTSATPASSGGAATTAVTTTTGCGWTAASNATWLTVTSGASGSDSGTVNYTVAVNTPTSPRSGTLTVAGQTVTVTQAAAACSYSVSPTSATPGSSGGAATAMVTTTSGCAWTATSNAPWLTVTSVGSGTGSGTVSYSSDANTSTSSRTGTLTVAGTTVTVTEDGFTLAPPPPPGNVHMITGP